jgi:hypothetical protein
MDMWEAMERAAVVVLGEVLDRSPFDRTAAINALEMIATAKHQGAQRPTVDWSFFDDRQLKEICTTLV